MPKRKVSATVSPERLQQAQELVGNGSVSVLDEAQAALVERELERCWIEAYGDPRLDDLPGEVAPDLAGAPWDGPPPR